MQNWCFSVSFSESRWTSEWDCYEADFCTGNEWYLTCNANTLEMFKVRALEIFLSMHYINLHFTYLHTVNIRICVNHR